MPRFGILKLMLMMSAPFSSAYWYASAAEVTPLPIIGMSARMVAQKGLDLILGSPAFLSLDAQFIFLGQGEKRYVDILRELAARAPGRIGVQTNFTVEQEHRLLAGADMIVMPSQYEPCGLTQMRAQRYGTLPVARRVGGLCCRGLPALRRVAACSSVADGRVPAATVGGRHCVSGSAVKCFTCFRAKLDLMPAALSMRVSASRRKCS